MSHHDLFDNRRQFQLERMILFSDAVFAIAITLLVIELKIPELQPHETMLDAFKRTDLFSGLFGLLLSFAIIGQFWTNHHRLFGIINNYDGRLLWLNLHLLFWIVLMPFSSALSSKYYRDDVWLVYCCNLFMIGLAIYFIWLYITDPKRNLSEIAHDRLASKMGRVRSLVIAFIFLLGGLMTVFHNASMFLAAHFVFVLIFPAVRIIKHVYRPKNNPAH